MTVVISLLLVLPASPAPTGVGAGLSIEELLGLTALSTFLVGFANLRLQSQLNDWRVSKARILDRLLSENYQENLLPIPTSLQKSSERDDRFQIGRVPYYSLALAIVSFSVSVYFSSDGWFTTDGLAISNWWNLVELDKTNYLAVHGLHLLILFLLIVEIFTTSKTAKKDEERSVKTVYGTLEREVEIWRKSPTEDNRQKLIDTCGRLSAELPGWSWLSLVKLHLNPIDFNSKQEVLRLRHLAGRSDFKFDTYSQIALVWSTYLIEYSHHLETQRAEESYFRDSVRGLHRRNLNEHIETALQDEREGWTKGFVMPRPLDAPAWTSITFETIERISETSRDSLMSNYYASNNSRGDFGDSMANLAIDSWIRCLNLENCKSVELPEHLRQMLRTPNFVIGGLDSKVVIFSLKLGVSSFSPGGKILKGLHGYHVIDAELLNILLTTDPSQMSQIRADQGERTTIYDVIKTATRTSALNRDFGKNRTRAEKSFLLNLERNLARYGQIATPNILGVLKRSAPIDCLDLWRHVKVIESRPGISVPGRRALFELSQWIIFHLQVGRK